MSRQSAIAWRWSIGVGLATGVLVAGYAADEAGLVCVYNVLDLLITGVL